MSEKDKHIIQDDFSQKIKEKLENHSMPVDENLWLEIEKKLAPVAARKKPVPFWYWLSGSVAAAAVLALLLIVSPFESKQNKDLISGKTEVTSTENTTTSQLPDDNRPIEIDLAEVFQGPGQSKKALSGVGVQKPLRSGWTMFGNELYQEPKTTKAEVSETSKSTGEIVSQIVDEKKDNENLVKEEAGTTVQESNKKTDILPDLNDYPEVVAPTKTRKKQPLLLAMSMETSNGLNVQTANDFSEVPVYSGVASPNRALVGADMASKYNSVLNVADFTQARHLPPVSVGITLVKGLSERIALESGLVYTYLKSEYTRPGITHYKASLHLHYLGIPLNLRVKLWNKPAWNIYISAGGMVEKGLRSFYNQEIDDGRAVLDTDIKSNIDGLQWSLNSALGIDVKIQKRLSLFVEPKLIYYLHNNQPESARTESPLYVGVNGGLRIEL